MWSNVPTFLVGSDWRIMDMDPQVAEWIGKPAHATIGQFCYEAIDAQNLDGSPFCRPECPLLTAFKEHRAVDAVVRLGPQSRKDLRVGVHYAIFDDPLRILHSVVPLESEGSFHSVLTRRQYDIIEKLARGLSHGEIAQQCHVAPSTIDTHLKRMRSMLSCHSDRELIAWYREHH
ncbi:MAG: hypothetical protein C7B44_11480 [Sulfobacillus thermosulfidooxidans]|nr:MAG: hypothetical protein C7B44_11480 [Sulfobacillus thermosulfidooxidans]